jgi:hypothetical protein
VLETLLLRLEGLLLAEKIEVGQDTKDVTRHTTGRQDVQELHRLHLEAIVSVNHEQDNVDNLGYVHHGGQRIGRALHECESPPL